MLGFLFFQGTGDDDDTVPESVVELCVSLLVEFSFVPFESLHTSVSKNTNSGTARELTVVGCGSVETSTPVYTWLF